MGGRARERGVGFHPFLRRNLSLQPSTLHALRPLPAQRDTITGPRGFSSVLQIIKAYHIITYYSFHIQYIFKASSVNRGERCNLALAMMISGDLYGHVALFLQD